jgi:host factor-I protein
LADVILPPCMRQLRVAQRDRQCADGAPAADAAYASATERRVAIMTEKAKTVQDVFLNHLRKNKTPVTIFLMNGIKLQGTIDWFDNFSMVLRRDGHSQLVYKSTISTIVPFIAVQLFDGDRSPQDAKRGQGDRGDRRP